MRRFRLKLAAHLGMTASELSQRMDSTELTEWMAEDRIEPIGPARYDAPIAILCKLLANCNGVKNVNAADFLPRWGRQQQTDAEMMAAMKGMG